MKREDLRKIIDAIESGIPFDQIIGYEMPNGDIVSFQELMKDSQGVINE